MTGPLAAALAAVMATTALYCAGRLVVAPLTGRRTERGVDALHVVMGSVMAATLLGVLSRRWDVIWFVGFGVAALWYIRAGLVRASRHSLQHGLGCLAMLAMLVTGSASSFSSAGPASSASSASSASLAGVTGMSGMGGMGGLSSLAVPAPGGLLLLVLAGGVLALTTLDTVHVSRSGAGSIRRVVAGPAGAPLAPRCAAGCRIVMGIAMAVALLAMV